jgi:hypothetical protein
MIQTSQPTDVTYKCKEGFNRLSSSPQKQKSLQKGCFSFTRYFDNKNDLEVQNTQWQRTKNKTQKETQAVVHSLLTRSGEQQLHSKLSFRSRKKKINDNKKICNRSTIHRTKKASTRKVLSRLPCPAIKRLTSPTRR